MMLEKIQAMADPTRLSILQLIQREELKAGEIAGHFPHVTRPAVSQHLRILKDAGLVSERREGTSRYYGLRSEGFSELEAFLASFWDVRLHKLKKAVEWVENN